jgi:beta-glucosidase/6-phospho-beta-glucosidase/beta-galactosidase
VQAIRARGKAVTKCGPVENINIAVPLVESPEHIKAAQTATRETNAPFLTVVLEGKYTDGYLERASDRTSSSPKRWARSSHDTDTCASSCSRARIVPDEEGWR